jgi:3-oxoacyl-[acyl-carrier-protein] synthase II
VSVDDGIVITGMGVVTPAGCSLDELWTTLLAGESTAERLDEPGFDGLGVRIGCRVRGFDDSQVVGPKAARRMDPFARFALKAAVAAYEDAGRPRGDPSRAAVIVGNGVGGQLTRDVENARHLELGPARVHPLIVPMSMPNAATAGISMHLGWHGPTLTVATACASGAHAIGEALHLLRAGRADVVLAGGTEAMLTPFALNGFILLQAVSRRSDDPARACRPFDADRDGFVMGEGAAFVVLERADDARRRGARIRARLLGYAANSDAFHLVMPAEDGEGAAACMAAAIDHADLRPRDIVHVNAHGTSTPLNDRAEASALRKVFGDDEPPVTSTKGVTGHMIGAAGAVELVASVLSIEHRTVPPTANFVRTDPGVELDVVRAVPRALPRGAVLSNSFGFGGHNACLVVGPG